MAEPGVVCALLLKMAALLPSAEELGREEGSAHILSSCSSYPFVPCGPLDSFVGSKVVSP